MPSCCAGSDAVGEISAIGLDLAKNVFQVHGADGAGAVLFRKKLAHPKESSRTSGS
jgi:hypothetical protein